MAKKLIAKGQATIVSQKDAYTINQSVSEFVFSANNSGVVTNTTSFVSTVVVTMGDSSVTNFSIGTIAKPAGFSAITVNNTSKTIIYSVTANTSTLADNGVVIIPIIIAGLTYNLSLTWSKAKAGSPGGETTLDWVADWDSGKTVIDAQSVITPKIFAGVKNSNGTITGVAIGQFSLSTRNTSGTIIKENISGIYGFKDGYKTFAIDTTGSVQLGYGNEYIKYNAATGKVEFGSAVALAWVGATYIDVTGIFTGTLSAGTVNAININASQITAGTINAALIDVDSLKSSLITADNINALILNVKQGKIGGWNLGSFSIYRGTETNTLANFTSKLGDITIGSAGIRGYKWYFDSWGSGAIAGGNISWNLNGTVAFSESVSLQWMEPISNINNALGGDERPKLTYISSTGIYTGTLTATQITAGTINADRIAVGSITAAKLDAASIKADIINVGYINGLSCTFTKGTIGGWLIATGSIGNGHISLDGTNRRIVVFGALGSSSSGQRVQLFYNSDSDFGLFATDVSGNCITSLGSVNKIAGWTINASQIYKNSVSLGADGSIINGTKWKLNNDGSGQIASGNISWNIAGAVTFSAAVSLNWKNDIEAAKSTNYGYRYTKSIVINGESGKYYPVVIKGGDQTVMRDILVRRSYGEQAPSDWNNGSTTHMGALTLLLKTNFGGWGGVSYSWDIYELSEMYARMFAGAEHCGNYCMFAVFLRGGGTTGALYHLYSDQPLDSVYLSESPVPQVAPQVCYNSDLIFKSGSTLAYASAPRTLTAAVENEIRRRKFISLAQGNDTTLTEHPLTYIGSTGIYTGTLTAIQINAVAINAGSITTGTLSADRIAVGSINASKLDAASIKAGIINTDYINGLSCTFVRGKIGGWTIGADDITAGVIGSGGVMPMQIRSAATGAGYWYTGSYKPFGISMTWHQSANAGHFVFGQIASAGNSVKTGFMGIQMMAWDHEEYFCLSANYTRSGSKEIYNRIAGWAFDNARIWKNSVSLGADGSIANSTKWQLNNDGSGRVASGNISWDVAGNVTFGSSVSLNWTTQINNITTALGGAAYPKLTQITSTGIYTGTLTASQITAGTIDAARINTESIRAAIVTANNINALTLTVNKGTIGGWSINSYQIAKNSVALSSDGSIVNGSRWRLNNDGSGQLANGNIYWDSLGNVTARGAIFNNVRINGSVRNPFVLNDSSIWIGGDSSNQQNFNNYDNIVATRGSWDENIALPWTLANSGRRVCIVNYKWRSTITSGYMSITAPSGKYFFEDGLAKTTVRFSNEYLELLGYGDDITFFGWIVLNRKDIVTSGKYGCYQQVLAQGVVSVSGTSVSVKYFTFDGTTLSVGRTGVGRYTVYLPWNLNSNYFVQLTGYYTNTPIYATVMGLYSSYFNVQTQDDSSANEGSFSFQVFSTANWGH